MAKEDIHSRAAGRIGDMPGTNPLVTFRLAGTLRSKGQCAGIPEHNRLRRVKKPGRSAASHRESVHKRWFAAYDE